MQQPCRTLASKSLGKVLYVHNYQRMEIFNNMHLGDTKIHLLLKSFQKKDQTSKECPATSKECPAVVSIYQFVNLINTLHTISMYYNYYYYYNH